MYVVDLYSNMHSPPYCCDQCWDIFYRYFISQKPEITRQYATHVRGKQNQKTSILMINQYCVYRLSTYGNHFFQDKDRLVEICC